MKPTDEELMRAILWEARMEREFKYCRKNHRKDGRRVFRAKHEEIAYKLLIGAGGLTGFDEWPDIYQRKFEYYRKEHRRRWMERQERLNP